MNPSKIRPKSVKDRPICDIDTPTYHNGERAGELVMQLEERQHVFLVADPTHVEPDRMGEVLHVLALCPQCRKGRRVAAVHDGSARLGRHKLVLSAGRPKRRASPTGKWSLATGRGASIALARVGSD